jgi:hypothetical protein
MPVRLTAPYPTTARNILCGSVLTELVGLRPFVSSWRAPPLLRVFRTRACGFDSLAQSVRDAALGALDI